MTSDNYCPPSNPTDPTPSQIAADLIVTAGATRRGALGDVLRSYADQLVTAGAFSDVTARDARTVAATIVWDLVHGDEATALRERAHAVADGLWGGWDHPSGVGHAFTVAANVIDAT
ncbi:hypothetical protein [Mycolicibacterium baixiangningiae]|uniref:hypothetical protein n=1 Tax=Mycolicibacterium baixiangningiae TaxID=2761578 RepID=UPI0018D04CD6|nr:hypothetical protein [Mycolicibacterium baixiangningiae]